MTAAGWLFLGLLCFALVCFLMGVGVGRREERDRHRTTRRERIEARRSRRVV